MGSRTGRKRKDSVMKIRMVLATRRSSVESLTIEAAYNGRMNGVEILGENECEMGITHDDQSTIIHSAQRQKWEP
jgi:hypothetical protein